MKLIEFKGIGKWVSLISFILIFVLSIVLLFLLDKEMYKNYLMFIEKFSYLWMTLSGFVGVAGITKRITGLDSVKGIISSITQNNVDYGQECNEYVKDSQVVINNAGINVKKGKNKYEMKGKTDFLKEEK